jgi:predicted nucleic acid-binding protein
MQEPYRCLVDQPTGAARIPGGHHPAGLLDALAVPPFPANTVRAFENQLQITADDAEVTALLLELVENPGAHGKQVHDANIVATMRRHRISHLLTHNTTDFRRYALWVTVLPLIP